MDEPTNVTTQEQTTTPTGAVTQPTAVNVDMDAINKAAEARAERAAQAVVKDMLAKQGLDDEAIKGVLAEWKSKQVTPEQTIAKLTDELAAERGKIATLEQERILRGHGLTDSEDVEIYGIRIGKLVTDGKTFEQAAQEYFTAHPVSTKTPARIMDSPAGKTPLAAGELDVIKAEYENAKKHGNSTKMVELRMLAKQKGFKFD